MIGANENATQLYRIIAEAASAVASQICGKAVNVEESEGESESVVLASDFLVSDSVKGALRFELSKEACDSVAVLLLGESEDELSEQTREAAQEFLRQVVGIVATSMRPHFGRVEIKPAGNAENFADGTRRTIALKAEGLDLSISLQLSNDLISSLNTASTAVTASSSDQTQTIAAAVPTATSEAQSAKPSGWGPSGENLDLVLDAELHVSIRFGRREMLLKDILDLTSGSVVELDRAVSEPVDLMVDKRIFARGEVVIVDGNYGVHITEVATPQQRIECLQ